LLFIFDLLSFLCLTARTATRTVAADSAILVDVLMHRASIMEKRTGYPDIPGGLIVVASLAFATYKMMSSF